jgi:hypothetical protein
MSRAEIKEESEALRLLNVAGLLDCVDGPFAYNASRYSSWEKLFMTTNPQTPRYDIPAQPPPAANDDSVLIVTCTTVLEADGVVKELKNAGIAALIENKFRVWTNAIADLRNAYPHIRIRISSKDYNAARKLLMKTARVE